jgi:hypothetical protein
MELLNEAHSCVLDSLKESVLSDLTPELAECQYVTLDQLLITR